MQFAGEFVTLDRLRIHVRRSFSEGPTLVMLHGLSDSGACWRRVASQFWPQIDLIAVDLRGHGLSDAPESGYAGSDFAQDVVGVLDSLRCSRVSLIGHSLGAETATQVARIRPDLVESVVLEDPPWSDAWVLGTASERALRAAEWARDLQALQESSFESILGRGRSENPEWDPLELEPWAESKQQFRLRALDYISSDRPAWQLVIRNLSCRVLLVTGETSRGGLVSAAMTKEARHLVPELQVLHLARAGHCVHRDQFEGYMAGVREFLAEN